jgi:hypothetical protein
LRERRGQRWSTERSVTEKRQKKARSPESGGAGDFFFVLFAGRFFGANARRAEEPVAANSPLRRFVHTTEEN